MQQKILIAVSVFVGFFLTLGLYLLFSNQHLQVDLPHIISPFSVDTPPSESLSGTLATMSGIVLWESRSATNPVVIHAPQKLQQGESLLTATGSATIDFPGIVQAVLAKDTQMNIIQTLPASFVLQQTKGSAVFTIASGVTPVSLRAMDLLISTSSATISLTVDAKKAEVGVHVQEGSVHLAYEDTNFVTQLMTLQKGQTFYFNNNTKKQIYSL